MKTGKLKNLEIIIKKTLKIRKLDRSYSGRLYEYRFVIDNESYGNGNTFYIINAEDLNDFKKRFRKRFS